MQTVLTLWEPPPVYTHTKNSLFFFSQMSQLRPDPTQNLQKGISSGEDLIYCYKKSYYLSLRPSTL